MPFYGVQKPQREIVCKELMFQFPLDTRARYEQAITALWEQPHREEKYTAIALARSYPDFMIMSTVPMFKRMIREGEWWDLVDEIAIHLVGHVLLNQRRSMKPEIEKWITDNNVWIRRAALLCHISHKEKTDEKQLFRLCTRQVADTDPFIRKAIGWALREYGKTKPSAVKRFLSKNKNKLSPLSYREASKYLGLKAA